MEVLTVRLARAASQPNDITLINQVILCYQNLIKMTIYSLEATAMIDCDVVAEIFPNFTACESHGTHRGCSYR